MGKIDAIEIWWPSGLRQRIAGPIAANNTIRIVEGDDRLEDVYPNKAHALPSGRQLELA